jgi:hypothetical protein
MTCEMCFHTIGHKYFLYSVKCDACAHRQKNVMDAEYIEFYGNLVHRFRPVEPFYCGKCGTNIVIVNWNCRDKDQRLAENKQGELVDELFGKVLRK